MLHSVQSILIKLCSCAYFLADCLASLNEHLYYNQCGLRLAYFNMQSSYMSGLVLTVYLTKRKFVVTEP